MKWVFVGACGVCLVGMMGVMFGLYDRWLDVRAAIRLARFQQEEAAHRAAWGYEWRPPKIGCRHLRLLPETGTYYRCVDCGGSIHESGVTWYDQRVITDDDLTRGWAEFLSSR